MEEPASDYVIKYQHYRVDKDTGELRHYFLHGMDEDKHPLCGWAPAEKGGETYCWVVKAEKAHLPISRLKMDDFITIGKAVCSKQDSFCYRIGRDISRGRAMKKLED